jgi:hypothetical protein
MNINKNNITPYKQLIGGDRREKGIFELYVQTNDTIKQYATGLDGTYKLTLQNIQSIDAFSSTLVFEIISDTLRIDRGSNNTYIKGALRNERETICTPMILRQTDIKNWIDLSFRQLGTIGSNIGAISVGLVLTFEYEKV